MLHVGGAAATRIGQHARWLKSAATTAGSLSYCKALFLGVNDERRCFPFPLPAEEEREVLSALVEPVQRFMANEVDSKSMDESKEMPDSVFKALGEMGLFGLQIPEELGGLGLSNTGYARVVEEVAVDPSLTTMLMAHQSIGLKGILLYGNDEQKQRYLPKLASGEQLA